MTSQNMSIVITLLFIFLMLIGFSFVEDIQMVNKNKYQVGYTVIASFIFYIIVLSMNTDNTRAHTHDNPLHNQLEDLDMVIVVANWCGYSKKAIELLEEENVKKLFKVVDSESSEFEQLNKRYDIKAFPTWISLKREVSVSGFNKDLNKLVERINNQSPDSPKVPPHQHKVPPHQHKVPPHQHKHHHEHDNEDVISKIKNYFSEDNPLIVMQRSGCPHCTTMKSMIKESHLEDHVVMTSSSEAVSNYGVNSSDVPGVPAFILKNNPGKVVLGARPSLEKVLEELEA